MFRLHFRLGLLALAPLAALLVAAGYMDQSTGPRYVSRAPALEVQEPSGPPASHTFGSDSYRTGLFTGAGTMQPGLSCKPPASSQVRVCNGYLASGLDGTLLDVTVQAPLGHATPHPLVVLLHGWGGSKSDSDDIANALVADGYAVLRYSARGFGQSWGQVNLADLNVELADLRSMVGQVVDERSLQIDPDAVAVMGASYGGGQSWLALLRPTFTSAGGRAVRIRAVVPIVPWSDLLYSLLPNGRPRSSINGLGGPKLSYVNGLYISGLRTEPRRPYPNYPDYLVSWHGWLQLVEPSNVDPVYTQIVDGLAGYRSIWWQQSFWQMVASNRVPVFQVQGFTDDLFPLPEAKRMLLALTSVDPRYPITSYFGDIGHPRAANKPDEVAYVLGLIRQWLAYHLRGVGSAPAPLVYAAITRPGTQAFDPADVITVSSYGQLATGLVAKDFDDALVIGSAVLVNPLSDPAGGFVWDPLLITGVGELQPYTQTPPPSAIVPSSLAAYEVPVAELTGGSPLLIAAQPIASLHASTLAHRVQLDVRLIDVAPDGTKKLITRGTYTLDSGSPATPLGEVDVVIPTYGNLWEAAPDHTLRLELTNVDSPYISPSRIPSTTVVSKVRLEVPRRLRP
jgi:pimeloyl-ACP methyl ester carboxylesterase